MPTGTGVFLSDNELAEVKKLATQAAQTPVIAPIGPRGPDLASIAWQTAKSRLHRYALAHGLPEIEGYYGANLETGEVLR